MFTRENVLNGVPTLCQDVILFPEGASNLKMSNSCKKPKEVCVWWGIRESAVSLWEVGCLSPFLNPDRSDPGVLGGFKGECDTPPLSDSSLPKITPTCRPFGALTVNLLSFFQKTTTTTTNKLVSKNEHFLTQLELCMSNRFWGAVLYYCL